jgi:hypothetical protein
MITFTLSLCIFVGIFCFLLGFAFYLDSRFKTKQLKKENGNLKDELAKIKSPQVIIQNKEGDHTTVERRVFRIVEKVIDKNGSILYEGYWEGEEYKKESMYKIGYNLYNWFYNKQSPCFSIVCNAPYLNFSNFDKGKCIKIIKREDIKTITIEKGYFKV